MCVEVDENHNKAEPCLVRARSEQSAEVFSLEETKFLKRKTADTFNASDSRQSTPAQIKKEGGFICLLFLFQGGRMRNTLLVVRRICGRHLCRIARIPSWQSQKARKRGYSSVEQIQDKSTPAQIFQIKRLLYEVVFNLY